MTTYPATDQTIVTVDISVGAIEITATDRTDIDLLVAPANPSRKGDLQAVENLRIDQVGDSLAVVATDKRTMFGSRGSVDLTLEVPAGTDFDIKLTAGTVTATGELGDVRCETSAGDVSFESTGELKLTDSHGRAEIGEVRGSADVKVSSGTVGIERTHGHTKVKGAHGLISLGYLFGPAEITTASGAIDVLHAAGDLKVRTAHGSITVKELTRGVADLESNNGGIRADVTPGTAVWVDADTKKGHVRTYLTEATAPEDSADTLELHAYTNYGDIRIGHTR